MWHKGFMGRRTDKSFRRHYTRCSSAPLDTEPKRGAPTRGERYADNYVTLWPGEAITIAAVYATSSLGGQPVYLRLQGYNVPEVSIPVP